MMRPCRETLAARGGAALVVAAAFAWACGTGPLVVGDDTRPDDPPTLGEGAPAPGVGPPPPAVDVDAAEGADATPDAGSGDARADVTCPDLSPPHPSFCDGGPISALYAANGCVAGYACAPVACESAGGACVALSPGACATSHYGSADRYSCGSALGVTCCLP